MNFRICLLNAAAVNLISLSLASATTITPTGATASTEAGNLGRTAIHTIDGSGLTNGLHSNTPDGTMWLSAAEEPATITWDLGASYELTGFHLWNYNEENLSARSIATGNILVSTTSDFSSGVTSFNGFGFTQASGVDGDPGLDYTFPLNVHATGQYVRFANVVNFSEEAYLGISEIRFTAIPEPSSIFLLSIGFGWLMTARRCRRK